VTRATFNTPGLGWVVFSFVGPRAHDRVKRKARPLCSDGMLAFCYNAFRLTDSYSMNPCRNRVAT